MSTTFETLYQTIKEQEVQVWYPAGRVERFPFDEGVCIKYKNLQIAVFHFRRKNEWFACQNLCPHRHEMVLSRGILGDENGIPKVACPMHKNTFSLKTGENLQGNLCSIALYPVKIEKNYVYIGFRN